MVRKKLLLKKIDNPSSRQITYSKRRDGIVKKATELSVLCGTDVGLLMFSPTGRLTCFASNGRIEDIFLRFLDRPNDLRGGSYNPDVEKITSVQEALLHQEFLTDAIQRIEQLKVRKVLGKHTDQPQKHESIEIPAVDIKASDLMTEDSVDYDVRRNPLLDDQHLQETRLPVGPHLSIDYLMKTQSPWNLQCGGTGTSQG
ncbi:hypothetical protein SLA2020_447090 [Shorea laevis]